MDATTNMLTGTLARVSANHLSNTNTVEHLDGAKGVCAKQYKFTNSSYIYINTSGQLLFHAGHGPLKLPRHLLSVVAGSPRETFKILTNSTAVVGIAALT